MREWRNVMLISPSDVKGIENVNNNVTDDTIGYAIRTAQDVYLQDIIGTPLLHKIQELVYNAVAGNPDTIDDAANVDYAMLLDEFITPYLAAATTVELLLPISMKIRNIGVSQNTDTNINSVSLNDIRMQINYYNVRVAMYATRISQYLCENKSVFPELENDGCCGQKALIGTKFQPTNLWLGNKKKGRCCNG